MEKINKKYQEYCLNPSDINEHLPTLKEYAEKCSHITEMGVRYVVSTYAFLASNPKKMISYDLFTAKQMDECLDMCKEYEIDFTFIQKDVLKVDIEETDLLFIDTFHTYTQLIKEFSLHSQKVRKYIILHDTTTYGINGELAHENMVAGMNCGRGIWFAVEEFLSNNSNWKLHKKFENNNGLTILERV